MIRDITIGQYYPADSMIHKLDPRTKLVGTIGVFVSYVLRICGGRCISCWNDPDVKGSGKIYFQGTEDHFYAASDYHIF